MKQAIIERLKTQVTYKQDLQDDFKLSERQVRLIIAEIAKEQPIMATSYVKGYKLATEPYECGFLYNTTLDLLSRISEITLRLEPQIKFLKENSQPTFEKEYVLTELRTKIKDEIKLLQYLNRAIYKGLRDEL